jgi:hypothetical protein
MGLPSALAYYFAQTMSLLKAPFLFEKPEAGLYINFGIETVDGSISLNLKFINVTMMVNFLSLPP